MQTTEAIEDTETAASAAEQEVEDALAKAEEYLALAQRKQAEFENFRRRAARESAQAMDRGVARLAKELLPTIDHFTLALRSANEPIDADTNPTEIVGGIERPRRSWHRRGL